MAGDRSFSNYVHPKYRGKMPGAAPGDMDMDDATKRQSAKGGGGFDPAEHNVDDVLDYMDEHPDLAEHVKVAERQGKNRKGILDHEAGK